MNVIRQGRRLGTECVVAFQFLTRIPMPQVAFEADSLSRAIKFFPLVGLVIGSGAVFLQRMLISHLSRPLIALVLLVYLVLITGCFHEDGLADTADGFGGGWTRDQVLLILKDSRIGSYGATALDIVIAGALSFAGVAALGAFCRLCYFRARIVPLEFASLELFPFISAGTGRSGRASR